MFESTSIPFANITNYQSILDGTYTWCVTAENWFSALNVKNLRGPIDPVAECWGFLVEGFRFPPVYMSPHNPPEYGTWIEASGFIKAKDLLVYEAKASEGYMLPERFNRFRNSVALRRPEIQVRKINTKKLLDEAKIILSIYNRGIDGNWGFTPVGEDEMEDVVKKLALILDPDAVWFVEDKGQPVGCALGFPDINVLIRSINGRLFPFGWWKILRGRRKLIDYRLWGLAVLPEYKGQGLDVLMYANLFDALKPRGIRLEANYVLEDNMHIINALEKLGMKAIKKYRVYEKPIVGETISHSPE